MRVRVQSLCLYTPLVFALACACGCYTVTPSSEERSALSRGTIRLLEIEEGDVTYTGKLPPEYEIDGGNSLLGNPYTAPIGILFEIWNYPKLKRQKSDRLRGIFRDIQVDVPELVGEEFTRLAHLKKIFGALHREEESPADAELKLEASYGIKGATFTTDEWSPWLTVSGTLVDSDGEVIWRKQEKVELGDGDLRILPFPDPFGSPDRVQAQFREAARIASRWLVEHLRDE